MQPQEITKVKKARKRNRAVVVASVVTLLLVVGVALALTVLRPKQETQATAAEQAVDGLKEYCEESLNICFQYPQKWSVEQKVNPQYLSGEEYMVLVQDEQKNTVVTLKESLPGLGSAGDRCGDIVSMQTKIVAVEQAELLNKDLVDTDTAKQVVTKAMSQDPDGKWYEFVGKVLKNDAKAGDSFVTELCSTDVDVYDPEEADTGFSVYKKDSDFANRITIDTGVAKTKTADTAEEVEKLLDSNPVMRRVYTVLSTMRAKEGNAAARQ